MRAPGLLILLMPMLLGVDTPRHRRFLQPNLPARSACATSASGSAIVNADWSDFANISTPTRTENYGADPNCGGAAFRLQVPGTTAVQFSGINALDGVVCPAGTAPLSAGCWVKGTSGTGTTDFCTEKSGYQCVDLPFIANWTWFERENFSHSGGGAGVIIGNISAVTGNGRSAVDLQLFGCRCVAGTTISP